MGAKELIEYLVLKQLAGRSEVLWIIYQYYIHDESISSIAERFNMSKATVRSYIQRVREKVSTQRARILVKYIVPEVFKLKPIATRVLGRRYICTHCYAELPSGRMMEHHIKDVHTDIVEKSVNQVLKNLKERIQIAWNAYKDIDARRSD